MITLNATNVRKEWSTVVDSVIREKPTFIRRTRDFMFLSDFNVLENLLSAYTFTAEQFVEDNDSVTLSLNEVDLVENGDDLEDAKLKLAQSIIEYSEDYYNDFMYWSSAPNRKSHVPYVIKALIIDDVNKIGELIQCQHGKS